MIACNFLLLQGSNINTMFSFHIPTYAGVVDSSGMEFSYIITAPQHRAGFLTIAHSIRKDMVIPPNAENYTISTICTGSCTQAVSNGSQSPVFRLMKSEWSTYRSCMCLLVCWLQMFPPEGITVFGSLLHTHLVGKKLSRSMHCSNVILKDCFLQYITYFAVL